MKDAWQRETNILEAISSLMVQKTRILAFLVSWSLLDKEGVKKFKYWCQYILKQKALNMCQVLIPQMRSLKKIIKL